MPSGEFIRKTAQVVALSALVLTVRENGNYSTPDAPPPAAAGQGTPIPGFEPVPTPTTETPPPAAISQRTPSSDPLPTSAMVPYTLNVPFRSRYSDDCRIDYGGKIELLGEREQTGEVTVKYQPPEHSSPPGCLSGTTFELDSETYRGMTAEYEQKKEQQDHDLEAAKKILLLPETDEAAAYPDFDGDNITVMNPREGSDRVFDIAYRLVHHEEYHAPENANYPFFFAYSTFESRGRDGRNYCRLDTSGTYTPLGIDSETGRVLFEYHVPEGVTSDKIEGVGCPSGVVFFVGEPQG